MLNGLIEDTYDLFTGGRAMSENLQLDRAVPGTKPDEPTVEHRHARGHHGPRDRLEAARQGPESEARPLGRVDPGRSARGFLSYVLRRPF